MERNNRIWLGIFMLLAALELIGEVLNNRSLILFVKPLLMPVLAIWLTRKTPGVRRFFRHTILAGLLFATLGDIFMLFNQGDYADFFFLIGLGAFLATHVCYLGGFLSEVPLKNGHLQRRPALIFPFLLFLVVFLSWLWPDIPDGLRQPVALYAIVISAMALSIVNLWGKVDEPVFTSLLCGALLFMGSDVLIAAYKFGHPFPGARFCIMASYIVGQWLIVRGVAERLRHFPQRP
jgi:uncharacterized membrane protein YhhN